MFFILIKAKKLILLYIIVIIIKFCVSSIVHEHRSRCLILNQSCDTNSWKKKLVKDTTFNGSTSHHGSPCLYTICSSDECIIISICIYYLYYIYIYITQYICICIDSKYIIHNDVIIHYFFLFVLLLFFCICN